MANPKYTKHVSRVVSLVQESGSWSGTSSDPHPPVGNEEGSTRLARVEAYFSEPTWPSSGRLIGAHLTLHESGTSEHSHYRGGNSRASVERINDAHPDGEHPSSTGGTAKEFPVNGSETHDVTDMVEEMLPSRIKRRSDVTQGCGNRPYGRFQIRSSDESDDSRSFIITDDLWLTVEIKTAVTPDAPGIIEVIGAQDSPTGGATMVGSTDGRTLAVRFAYHGAAGDRPAKAELALHGIGATDATPGVVVKTTGSVVPTAGGSAGVYSIRLTGITQGTAGRFRIRTTSQKGEQGDWSSLDGDESWVQMATIPGPPLDITFQPFASSPHILFSLNSADPTDYIKHAEAEVTYVPQGIALDPISKDIGGTTRRADLDTGVEFTPGQVVSYRVRTTNQDGVGGQWSAPQRQTLREAQAVTFSPAPGRLTSVTPTITLSFPVADGARLRLLDPADDNKVFWDSGATVLVDQTSHAFAVPAAKLSYGQSFRAVPSYVPNGGGVTYTAEDIPAAVTYSIANLPTSVLSVPDAVLRKVGTTTPEWLRTVTDKDGATTFLIAQAFYAAATPQGTGAFIHQFVGGLAGPVAIPGLAIAYETAVDSIMTATNDIDPLAASTLSTSVSAGATSAVVASATGFVTGQDVVFNSAISGETEVRRVTVTGTTLTWPTSPALEHGHTAGQAVTARVFGPLSNWLTITALQPPDVDLITPVDAATLTDPTDTLDWSTTGHGGRTQASAVVTLYTADGSVLVTLPVATDTTVDIPAYLLDTGTGYSWDVTATDTQGMVTTSVARTFTTSFADPLGITVLYAVADPDTGTVVLTWDDTLEPFVDHIEVYWPNDEGEPIRIDGGPETLQDGNPAFIGTTLAHLGARLGENTYYVSVSNGWRSSDPVSASVTLTRPDALAWELVDAAANAWGLIVTGASIPHAGTIERYQAPGGQPRQITWGSEARRLPLTIETVPSEDRELVSTFRDWMATGTPVWVKGPEPYALDPLWATLQDFTPTPLSWGGVSIDLDWLELGDPVHSLLPPPVPVPDEGEGDLYTTTDTLDFGTQAP